MTAFLIIATIAACGIVAIFVLLLRGQKTGRETTAKWKKELKAKEDAQAKLTYLTDQIEELEHHLTSLKGQLKSQNDPSQKGADTAYEKLGDLIDATKLKDIMTKDVITIKVDRPFSEVPKKMKEYHVRHLPVVDGSNKLLGLITQRMMYKIISPRKLMDGEWHYDEEMLNNVILKHVMVKEIYALSPEQSLGKALMKMVYSKYGCIPVVDGNNRVVGIVTREDILKLAADIYQNR